MRIVRFFHILCSPSITVYDPQKRKIKRWWWVSADPQYTKCWIFDFGSMALDHDMKKYIREAGYYYDRYYDKHIIFGTHGDDLKMIMALMNYKNLEAGIYEDEYQPFKLF